MTLANSASGTTMSVRQAHLATRLHEKRLRKILSARGFIAEADRAKRDAETFFDADAAAELLNDLTGSMSLKDAGLYLNAPRPHERILLDEGFIRPIVAADEEFKDHVFSKRELDGFLDRLFAGAEKASPLENWCDLLRARLVSQRPVSAIIRLILDGRVAVRRAPGEAGYLSVRVDPDQVVELVRGEVEPGALTLREVEKALGTATRVVKALVDHGHLASKIVANPRTNRKQPVVSQAAVTAFLEEYGSLMDLASETGRHFRRLKSDLADHGVEPAFDPEQVSAAFYRRDEVAAALQGFNPA